MGFLRLIGFGSSFLIVTLGVTSSPRSSSDTAMKSSILIPSNSSELCTSILLSREIAGERPAGSVFSFFFGLMKSSSSEGAPDVSMSTRPSEDMSGSA